MRRVRVPAHCIRRSPPGSPPATRGEGRLPAERLRELRIDGTFVHRNEMTFSASRLSVLHVQRIDRPGDDRWCDGHRTHPGPNLACAFGPGPLTITPQRRVFCPAAAGLRRSILDDEEAGRDPGE